jgi:hypothetical protein
MANVHLIPNISFQEGPATWKDGKEITREGGGKVVHLLRCHCLAELVTLQHILICATHLLQAIRHGLGNPICWHLISTSCMEKRLVRVA